MLGICIFNLVPVRATPSDKSEMVTQLLFGELYKVLEKSENGKWIFIEILEDKYQGWIDIKLHTTANEGSEISNFISTNNVGYVKGKDHSQMIFFGSYLPSFQKHYVYINNVSYSFEGESEKTEQIMESEKLIENAKLFLGTPYLWGGRSMAGIDCSGFVQIVFRSCGYSLLRDAWQQGSMGLQVENIEKAKSGDLAFFCNDENRITHVGILTDQNAIIHAHGKVRIDKIDGKGIINGDTGLYSHKLHSIRTIIGHALN